MIVCVAFRVSLVVTADSTDESGLDDRLRAGVRPTCSLVSVLVESSLCEPLPPVTTAGEAGGGVAAGRGRIGHVARDVAALMVGEGARVGQAGRDAAQGGGRGIGLVPGLGRGGCRAGVDDVGLRFRAGTGACRSRSRRRRGSRWRSWSRSSPPRHR